MGVHTNIHRNVVTFFFCLNETKEILVILSVLLAANSISQTRDGFRLNLEFGSTAKSVHVSSLYWQTISPTLY